MRRTTAFTYALQSIRLGGSADFGQLGRPDSLEAQPVLLAGQNIVLGACGLLHTLLVSGDGTVWGFGKAAGGRLGNGNDIDDCHEPHPSFKSNKLPIKSISAGSMHNCLVTSEGELFGWGYDSVGSILFIYDRVKSIVLIILIFYISIF